MDLEENIEQSILEYLHLEYGETPDDSDALKITDIKYEGLFILDGVETHYWSYPTSSPCWAIVQPFQDSYCFSMSTTPPSELKHA